MLFKVKVPRNGHKGFIFLNAPVWFDARGICQTLFHDAALEVNWRSMIQVQPKDLVLGDVVYWLDPQHREPKRGTVQKPGRVPTKSDPEVPAKKTRKK